MISKIIKTGVVGVGRMGINHARIYSELPGSMLVGVYDINLKAAEHCANLYGCRAYSTLKEFLKSGVEAVSVAVPTSFHAEIALELLEKGIHVLVEKPIADKIDDALAMIQIAESYNLKLMVGHVERFNPAVQAIKSIIKNDEIISINMIRVGPRPPHIKDTGVIVDMAVHDIDLIRYITNQEIKSVYCVSKANFDVFEDSASILIETEAGIGVQLTVNWVTPYKAREIQIITSSQLIRANFLTQHAQSIKQHSINESSYIVKDIYVQYREPLREQLKTFLKAIRYNQIPPVTGRDGLQALEVALRATNCKTHVHYSLMKT